MKEPIMKVAEDIQYAKNLTEATRLLREYAHDVIEECRTTFRWEWDYPESPTAMEIVDPDTVEEVKRQL